MIAPPFLVSASFSFLDRLCSSFMALTRENIVNYDRAVKYDNHTTLYTALSMLIARDIYAY